MLDRLPRSRHRRQIAATLREAAQTASAVRSDRYALTLLSLAELVDPGPPVKSFAFVRPGANGGVELCVVRTRSDGSPDLIVVPLAPLRALELGHDLAQQALPQMRARS